MRVKHTDAEIAAAVARHGTIVAAARAMGISRATVHRALKRPGVAQLVGGALGTRTAVATARALETAVALREKIADGAGRAVDVIVDLLADPAPSIRLRAAQALADLAARAPWGLPAPDEHAAAPTTLSGRVAALARAQATNQEIADALGIETQDHVALIVRERSAGRAELRAALWDSRDNPRVAEQLAFQHLGWTRTGYDAELRAVAEEAERLIENERHGLHAVGASPDAFP